MKEWDFHISPWHCIRRETVYQTSIFDLIRRQSRLKEVGVEGTFYVIDAPTWVNVIATTSADEVVLVEQFRHGIEEPTLEIPGGVADENETPREAAERELAEETGYESDHWHDLGSVSSNPAIFSNRTRIYWAEDCEWGQPPKTDEHEFIHTHQLPVNQFLGYVRSGEIHHALVVAAAAKFMLYQAGEVEF